VSYEMYDSAIFIFRTQCVKNSREFFLPDQATWKTIGLYIFVKQYTSRGLKSTGLTNRIALAAASIVGTLISFSRFYVSFRVVELPKF